MEEGDGASVFGTLTQLISQIESGSKSAHADFCDLVYSELKAIGRRLRLHKSGSLCTTELVHEFLERVLSDGRLGQMKNRRYFYTAAADQMRRIMIDHWRHRQAQRNGGHLRREELDPWLDELAESVAARAGGDLEALDSALVELKLERPRQYQVVQLKFFGGLTNNAVAEVLDVSVDTVKRDWQSARARLALRVGPEK